jgi:nucleotide-binding universal stress UspA family protein
VHRARQLFRPPVTYSAAPDSPLLGVGPSALVLGREPPQSTSRAIVAGYDGSPRGQAAVVEAGLLAGDEGCVFVVYAYRTPAGFLGAPYFDRRLSAARETGVRALTELLSGRARLPVTEYIPELLAGAPADTIARVAAARSADAIVVGAGHTRRLAGMRWSVARKLKRIADAQVIMIH